MATTAMAARRVRTVEAAGIHVVTALLALWMTAGSYMDAWAHTHVIDTLEGFFTPWHGILYTGYALAGIWIARHRDLPGYNVGFIGVMGFALGGAADLVWHTLYGIEANAVALISPPHLLLMVSHILIVSTPLVALWRSDSPRTLAWRAFLPAGLSLLGLVAAVSFMFMYETPFNDWLTSSRFASEEFSPDSLYRIAQKGGIAVFLWSSVIYTVPLLALLLRWRPPFGTATLAIGVPAIGVAIADPLLLGAPVLAVSGIAMGLAADVLIRYTDPSVERPLAFVSFGAVVPAVLTVASLVLTASVWGSGWPATLNGGSVFLAVLTGAALAFVLTLPRSTKLEVSV
jgi:hypothetical protein